MRALRRCVRSPASLRARPCVCACAALRPLFTINNTTNHKQVCPLYSSPYSFSPFPLHFIMSSSSSSADTCPCMSAHQFRGTWGELVADVASRHVKGERVPYSSIALTLEQELKEDLS